MGRRFRSERGSNPMLRRCDYCRGRIAKSARRDARYCSQTCQVAAYRHGRQREVQMEEKVPKEVASLAALLMASPEEAVGYKLGIALEGAQLLTFFPPACRRSKRFDGSFSVAPFFRLRPFEPPRIPIVGRYAVRIFDAAGRQLPTPAALSMGVDVTVCVRGNALRRW